jgi:hypothetical protein
MTGRPSPEPLIRRSRVIGWATGAGASLATVGLIVGVAHSSQAATTTSTPTSQEKTRTSTSSSRSSSVEQAPPAQQPMGGSNGS